MPSPPLSAEETLFFSSPVRSSPEDEVPDLIAKAKAVTVLNPALAKYLKEHGDALYNLFRRQVQLIQSRRQSFEDGRVTVFDKVLLNLTRNGLDLKNPPALHWYCEEFLGINLSREQTQIQDLLTQDVNGRVELEKAILGTSQTNTRIEPVPSSVNENIPMEPKLKRLWCVYEQARSDYLDAVEKKNVPRLPAARFLRDTAENTLEYLKNKNIDPLAKNELEATYNMAKNEVVDLTGGKKRKFDRAEMEEVRGIPRAPMNFPSPTRQPGVGRRRDSTYGNGGRGNRQVRGRGHSQVPYGYTRPVDSYHPSRY